MSHIYSKLSHVTPTLQKNHAIALSLFTLLLLLVASNNACKITDRNKPLSGNSFLLYSTSKNISAAYGLKNNSILIKHVRVDGKELGRTFMLPRIKNQCS